MSKRRKCVQNDQHMTPEPAVKECVDFFTRCFSLNTFDLIVEPSCGEGSFVREIRKRTNVPIDAVDIEPKIEPTSVDDTRVIKSDFIKYSPENERQNILVIGNPPFGKNSNTAFDFVNRAAVYAKLIAFVVPGIWAKPHFFANCRIDPYWHICGMSPMLKRDLYKATTMRTIFVILKKGEFLREPIKLPKRHPDFDFLGPVLVEDASGGKPRKFRTPDLDKWELAIRTKGWRKTGVVKKQAELMAKKEKWAPDAFIFIKVSSGKDVEDVFNTLEKARKELRDCAKMGSCQDSLTLGEIVKAYENALNEDNESDISGCSSNDDADLEEK